MPFVSLGTKIDSPSSPDIVAVKSDEGSREYFPTLFIEKAELGDLPDEGTVMIKYRVVRHTKTKEKTPDGEKTRHSMELEVRAIGKYDDDKEDSHGEELDKLRAEVEKEKY